jgi:hypothetical protein
VFAIISFGDPFAMEIERTPFMGEIAQSAKHGFWRPPIETANPGSVQTALVETCDQCESEFIVGSRFCHSCGASRAESSVARDQSGTSIFPFASLGRRLHLPMPALLAFMVGIVCLIGAATVGIVFSARTVLDWQAVQLWRIEWLLGAVAAFVAGCLLKPRR